jgi:hypothetical protein
LEDEDSAKTIVCYPSSFKDAAIPVGISFDAAVSTSTTIHRMHIYAIGMQAKAYVVREEYEQLEKARIHL